MKVVQVMGGSGEGGLEKHVVELSNAMSAFCELVVIAHPKYRSRFSDAVIFEPLDLSKSRKNPVLLYRLLRIINTHQPNIVHAQANKAALLIATIKPFLNCKTVVTIHNLKKNLKFISKFDLSIGVSQGVAAQFENAVSQKVVYNGIPLPDVTKKPDLPSFSDNSLPMVLAVGRLVPAKGFDILLGAWEGVHANLMIAGDGPDKALLERQLEESEHLKGHVRLLGHRDDVPCLIAGADLVVISSRREGFSYVFSEALLSEIPVISTDVPIPNEILPSKCICEIENAEALRVLIQQALVSLRELPEYYAPVFEYAKQNLTIDTMVQKTLTAYREL